MHKTTSNDHSGNINPLPSILISHNWFSEIILSKEDGVIATDTKGKITTMNKVAEELTGWSISESKDKSIESIFDAINESTLLPIENPINKALKENKITLLANHTILIKKDKTQRIIVDSAMPLHNEKAEIIGGALIFRDVTEHSLNKRKLDKSSSTLNGILENTDSIIYIKDIDGKCLFINKQAEKVYSIKANDLTEKNAIGQITNKHSAEPVQTDLNAIINSRLVESEEEIMHPDGIMHIYHVAKFPLFDSDDKAYAICAILTDISDRMAISELKEQLSKLAIEKGSQKDNLELVERLQAKNKDLQQFAKTVSHDLRAPIARILGLVTVSHIDPQIKINDQTILENVAGVLTALDTIVKDMNATIAIRNDEKHTEYVDFNTELKLIEHVLGNEIKESKASITANFEYNQGIITVKSYLYSIMYNLVSNAIKYRLPDVPLKIELQSRQINEFICLIIKDNGMGIDLKKNGNKIFGLYKRFHNKKIAGKGIGLNLVKIQAEALGGKVEVESDVNQGSTFRIYFPINAKTHFSKDNSTATEVNPPAKRNETKEEAERTKQIIADYHNAALHLDLASKFNIEAAGLHQSGNHYEGEQSALMAQGHFRLAGKYQAKRLYPV